MPTGTFCKTSSQSTMARPRQASASPSHCTIVLLEEGLGEDGKWAKVSYWGTEGYMLRKSIKEGCATVYVKDGMEETEK